MSKKLINEVDRVVEDMLEGLVASNPGLRLVRDSNVVISARANEVKGKVAIISGGGSGHEPFAAGFIGQGMLTAACPGPIFTSPPSKLSRTAIRLVAQHQPAGIIVFVYNYTGDRLTFGIAVEKEKVENASGIPIEMYVNGDDLALDYASKAGRRGLAGNHLLMKIAGGMAEDGKSIQDVMNALKESSKNLGTMGVALTPCSIPGQGPLFDLASDEIELGLGVHGEAGVRRTKIRSSSEVVATILNRIVSGLDLVKGDEVILLLNNLGGTPKMEELITIRDAILNLEIRGMKVVRALSGQMMTSLEMAGIQISVLKVTNHPEWLRYLDAPTDAPAWPRPLMMPGIKNRFTPDRLPSPALTTTLENIDPGLGITDPEVTKKIRVVLEAVCKDLLAKERTLNSYDSRSGDGDCGAAIARGIGGMRRKEIQGVSKEVSRRLESGSLDLKHPKVLSLHLADIAENTMGGSSGGLYSLFFTAASHAFHLDKLQDKKTLDWPSLWCLALQYGLTAIQKYGGAEPGDRTMLDALVPAHKALSEALYKQAGRNAALQELRAAAEKGAEETRRMEAKAGRASYVSKEELVNPDPGATAVSIWIGAVSRVLLGPTD
ncbi:unnamed protein product [Darwinula stevensoni]|uniref:Triokinase/FMN cyclase n=1 Tax=Darwinula stevensoni TaxID=69355 RepID=A0A7R8ZYK9_9CRUS|nr:unnamed protein product [Darwinula stevensoni]CAG0880743.1 unnamed protein product [Darwinula stevensoni]